VRVCVTTNTCTHNLPPPVLMISTEASDGSDLDSFATTPVCALPRRHGADPPPPLLPSPPSHLPPPPLPLQLLKAAMHYSVGEIVNEQAETAGVTYSRRFIAVLTDLVVRQCGASVLCFLMRHVPPPPPPSSLLAHTAHTHLSFHPFLHFALPFSPPPTHRSFRDGCDRP
jgi:hypothetical protein